MKLSDSDKRLLQQMQNVKSSFKRVLEVILTKFTRKMLLAVAGILVTAAAAGSVLYFLWQDGAFLPGWITWQDRQATDASGAYDITLDKQTVEIRRQDTLVWSSPRKVKVQDVLCWDIDNDGVDELVLLCWKIGRYGKYRPFWVDKDEETWSQHLFVYEFAGDTIQAKWMSSYMGIDVADLAAGQAGGVSTNADSTETDETGTRPAMDPTDTTTDRQPYGSQRPAPRNRLLLTDPQGKISYWYWDSWGFAREETEVTFAVFGDNLIHGQIYRYGLREDPTFGFLYRNIRETLQKTDVTVINQETPLVDNPALYGDYPRFGTPAGVGYAIADAGFQIATCATNHALDRGMEGINFTKELFTSRNVLCLGIQSETETEYVPYELLRKNNIRFALLNYTYGTNGMPLPSGQPHAVHLLEDEARIRADIAQARKASDFVILFVHWGTEYAGEPDAFQEKWTQVFLEAGVDVVVGTHPHVLQPFTLLEDEDGRQMLVYASIGNYISAQEETSCVKGGMAHFTVSLTQEGFQVTEYGLEPLVITREENGRYTVDFAPPAQ